MKNLLLVLFFMSANVFADGFHTSTKGQFSSALLPAGTYHASTTSLSLFCPNSMTWRKHVDCLRDVLVSRLNQSSCYSQRRLSMNYEVIYSCEDSRAVGQAVYGADNFSVCTEGLQNTRSQIKSYYSSRSSNASEIVDYVIENLIFEVLVHESLHLQGYKHGRDMDSQISFYLGCANLPHVYSSGSKWASWVFNLAN